MAKFLRDQFEAIAKKMRAQLEAYAGVKHGGVKGRLLEESFADFLRSYIPRRFDVGRGQILTGNGLWSAESDVIVYDGWQCPVLATEDTEKVVPIESVYAVVEVKATITKQALTNAVTACRKLKSMHGHFLCTECGQTSRQRRSVATILFGQRTDTHFDTLCKNVQDLYEEIPPSEQLNAIYVLGEGVLAPNCRSGRLPFTTNSADDGRWESLKEKVPKSGGDWHALLWLYLDLVEFLSVESQLRPSIALDWYAS